MQTNNSTGMINPGMDMMSAMVMNANPYTMQQMPLQEFEAAGMPEMAPPNPKPGRVLFLRNMPKTVTEQDLMELMKSVSSDRHPRVYVQAARGQGFVEFSNEEVASKCLDKFNTGTVQMKGNTVHATYSTHETVVTHEQHINRTENASRVLLVHVVNLTYPVTLDMLHQIFSKYGLVERIVTFQKDATVFQAFVQFGEVEQATSALRALDNQNIYTGCNCLRIQYSRFTELTVRFNNSRSRDYTDPSLPAGEFVAPMPYGVDHPGTGIFPFDMQKMNMIYQLPEGQYPPTAGPPGMIRPHGFMPGGEPAHPAMFADPMASLGMSGVTGMMNPGMRSSVLICYKLVPNALTVDELFNLFSFYGHVVRIKIMHSKPDSALIQFSDPEYAHVALQNLEGCILNGQAIHLDFAKMKEITFPTGSPIFQSYEQGHAPPDTPSGGSTQPPTPATQVVTPSGQPVDTSKYKQFSIQDRRYGGTNTNVREKTMRSACKPTQLLHVANIPASCTLDNLRELFGGNCRCRFLPAIAGSVHTGPDGQVGTPMPVNTKMAHVLFNDVESATLALMHCHNLPQEDNRKLKVSFSKSTPQL